MPRNGLLAQRQPMQTAQYDSTEGDLPDVENSGFDSSGIETVAEAFALDGGSWDEFVDVILGDDLNLLSQSEIEACHAKFTNPTPQDQYDTQYG